MMHALIVTSIMCCCFCFLFLINLLCVSIRLYVWPEAKISKCVFVCAHSENPNWNLNVVLVFSWQALGLPMALCATPHPGAAEHGADGPPPSRGCV